MKPELFKELVEHPVSRYEPMVVLLYGIGDIPDEAIREFLDECDDILLDAVFGHPWRENVPKENQITKQEEVKMETVVQDVKFEGVAENTVVPSDTAGSVEIFHFGDFTVARVKKDFSGKKWQGVGVSRQSKDDQRNEKLGDSIAVGRASKAIKLKIEGVTIRHPYMA